MNLLLKTALYLRSEASQNFPLLPSDLAILFILASHIGPNTHCWIDQKKFAKECRLKYRQLQNRLAYLQSINLIKMKKTRSYNEYFITIPEAHAPHSSAEHNNYAAHSGADPIIQATHSNAPELRTPVPVSYALRCASIEKNIENKIEREREPVRASLTPPSLDFIYEPKIHNLLSDRNLDFKEMNEKFIRVSRKNGKKYADQNSAFEDFILREKIEVKAVSHATSFSAQPSIQKEIIICEECKGDAEYCRCRYMPSETSNNAMKEIRKTLKRNFINH